MLQLKKMIFPDKVKFLMKMMNDAGFEIYAVGGCVRDSLLGHQISDYDFTTNARPDQVKKVFNCFVVLDTGIEHGTVSVIIEDDIFEITTYRIDGEYSDNRHPNNVIFSDDLTEDLARRDFTINALAADIDGNIIDKFGGIADLNLRIIRCVGDPMERFHEDALRILRAIRFCCKINGKIETNTRISMIRCKELLDNIAKERIQKEFNGILTALNKQNCKIITQMFPILNQIIPWTKQLNTSTINENQANKWLLQHAINTCINIEPDIDLRLAAFFHDIGKCNGIEAGHAQRSAIIVEDILKRLRYSNDVVRKVTWLIREHEQIPFIATADVKLRLRTCPNYPLMEDLIKLQLANSLDHVGEIADVEVETLMDIQSEAKRIIDKKEPYKIQHLAINGDDLLLLGYKGKDIGDALEALLDAVIFDQVANEKSTLINYLVNEGEKGNVK